MIKLENGRCFMAGTTVDLMAECTAILASVYNNLKKELGEEKAKEALAFIGRLAVDPETVEKGIENIVNISIPMGKK